MKRIPGMILGLAFCASIANGGSIGGTSNGKAVLIYNPSSYIIIVPGQLDERIVIMRHGESAPAGHKSYIINPRDFSRLQDEADSEAIISVKDENNTSRSYRVYSGDENSELELIDRRAAIRSGTNR